MSPSLITMNITPQLFRDIAVGDRFAIQFGNFAEYSTFAHPCVVVAHTGDLVVLRAEPLTPEAATGIAGGKRYEAWLPRGDFEMGRPALSRRATHYERGTDHQARLHEEAREEQLAAILRETGHADFSDTVGGEIIGHLGALLNRLEALGLKLPEPVIPALTDPSGEAAALHAALGQPVEKALPSTGRSGPGGS